jgi:hypothetical protein
MMRSFKPRTLFLALGLISSQMAFASSSILAPDNKKTAPTLKPHQQAIPAPPKNEYLPWLTGTLIAPSGYVVPLGHFQVQFYNFCSVNTAVYNKHWNPRSISNFISNNSEVFVYVGLTEFMDILFAPQTFYNHTQRQSSFHLGDTPVNLDFQIIDPAKYKHIPGIKFSVIETFPTGKYQKLNPKKLGTDQTGQGAFSTGLGLVLYKIHHLGGEHYLSMTIDFEYQKSVPVHVKGFNAYGGGNGARGKVYPGDFFTFISSFEYSLNANWVLATDIVFYHQNKSRFKGRKGVDKDGLRDPNTRPSTEQYSLTGGIEYNFSQSIGISAGGWFSVAGRNTPKFASGVLSFYYLY